MRLLEEQYNTYNKPLSLDAVYDLPETRLLFGGLRKQNFVIQVSNKDYMYLQDNDNGGRLMKNQTWQMFKSEWTRDLLMAWETIQIPFRT